MGKKRKHEEADAEERRLESLLFSAGDNTGHDKEADFVFIYVILALFGLKMERLGPNGLQILCIFT